jgi:hypothetical protein
MGHKCVLGTVVALSLAWGGSVTWAFDPLGAPKAGPAAGQFEVGSDFLYGTVDLDFSDKVSGGTSHDGYVSNSYSRHISTHSTNQPTSKLYATIGYGILQNWEAFLRLGGADSGLRAGTMFAFGGGTKVTLYETGNWSFGGILQASWSGSDGDLKAYSSTNSTGESLNEYSVSEVQTVLGACYRLNSQITLYGGPTAALVRGTAEYKTSNLSGTYMNFSKTSRDVEEESWFGGYLGAQVELHANILATLEYQHVGGSNAAAFGLLYRFGATQ